MKSQLAVATVVAMLCLLGIPNVKAESLAVSSNPLWTDTTLSLQIGDSVTITASGSWQFDYVHGSCGPDGMYVEENLYDRFYSGALQGALVAYVGPDPYQGHWGDESFFPQATGYWNIGSSAQFTSDKDGELWLGFNDDAVSAQPWTDNSGSV
ncbi:MAG TPA: hypothetical protein VL486_12125, partial [Verrucomicrobiae bacterium]|nr:hypothetical protein [Verrucomicrobiae bacterium]